MMQEEVTNKTVALVLRTTKLTAEVLEKAIQMYLEHQKRKGDIRHGKISVKDLVGQNAGVTSIEVTNRNIKQFEKVAKKYNVDFSVKKDKTVDPAKYLVFFKGRDTDIISQAFKEFVQVNKKSKQKVSLKEKLQKLVQVVAQNKNKERTRQKAKERGQSL